MWISRRVGRVWVDCFGVSVVETEETKARKQKWLGCKLLHLKGLGGGTAGQRDETLGGRGTGWESTQANKAAGDGTTSSRQVDSSRREA
jgi:hypothetical protein